MKYAYEDKKGKLHLVHNIEQWQVFRGVRDWPNLTDKERRKERWYPVEEENTEYDSRIQERSGPKLSLDEERGVVIATYEIRDKSVNSLIREKVRQIEAKRDRLLAAGVEYTFPDDETAIIQTRNEGDMRNILAKGAQALAYVSKGLPSQKMVYRTADNITRQLSAQQMTDMTNHIASELQDIYEASWAHKDAVRDMTDPVEIVEYDIEAGW